MNYQHDPANTADPADPTDPGPPPDQSWDEDATVVQGAPGPLPAELAAELQDADVPDEQAPPAAKKKRRGLGCVGAAIAGVLVLGVAAVALAGIAVVGVAGTAGALYYIGMDSGEEVAGADMSAPVYIPAAIDGGAVGTEAGGETPVATLDNEAVAGVDEPDVAAVEDDSHAPGTPDVAPLGAGADRSVSPARQGGRTARSSSRAPAPVEAAAAQGAAEDEGLDLLGDDDEDDFGLVEDLPAAGGSSGFVDLDAPTKPERSTGKVKVSGEGVVVTLVKGGKRLSVPGPVPTGRYDIEAVFDGDPAVVVGSVKVRSGADVSLNCNARMGICRVQ